MYAVLDADACHARGLEPETCARAMVDGGARFLQVRAKRLPSGALLALVDRVLDAARSTAAVVVVNDRIDAALMAGAQGVHLGQTDAPAADARRLLGPGAVIGRSTHTRAQVDAARAEPISYLAVGPVFETASKDTGDPPVGLALVGYAADSPLPVAAIGGVTLERAQAVIQAGAASVAVISDLLVGGDPAARVRAYLRMLGED